MLSVGVAIGVMQIEVAVDLNGIVVPDCQACFGHGWLSCSAAVAEAVAVVRAVAEGLVFGAAATAEVGIAVYGELVAISIGDDELAANPAGAVVGGNDGSVGHGLGTPVRCAGKMV